MSRMTASRRRDLLADDSLACSDHVVDWPASKLPYSLTCRACGTTSQYRVGTIVIDPEILAELKFDIMSEGVGFTGLFRCVACNAGGPWDLPEETRSYVSLMLLAATGKMDGVPLVIGKMATFDKRPIRYATEAEDHILASIDLEPERAFLWVRLGNVYKNSQAYKRAQSAYERAIELDPQDVEAHGLLGEVFLEIGEPFGGVPHWQAVLRHIRDARHVDKDSRRALVRSAIENLLQAKASSEEEIEVFPRINPESDVQAGDAIRDGEPDARVLELHEFDLHDDDDMTQLCDMLLGESLRRWEPPFRRRKKKASARQHDYSPATVRRESVAVGRNDLCPCGSNLKYKKCCLRSPK